MLHLACASLLLAAPDEPVALKDGTSPNKRFEIVLEADKDTPSFAAYELKGDSYPKFLVREVSTGKIVGRLACVGDSQSDAMPLREHATLFWRQDSLAVVINTSERFYSHSVVLAYDLAKKEFREVAFPDYKTSTGFAVPSSDDLRPRGFSSARGWDDDGRLTYEIMLVPGAAYRGADPLYHRITLHVSPGGMEVVSREALKNPAAN